MKLARLTKLARFADENHSLRNAKLAKLIVD